MPELPENGSGVGYSFGLEVDGVLMAMVLEVFGLRLQRAVVEVKENAPDGTIHVRRVPGGPLPGEVVLTRALTADTTFETWVQAASLGGAAGAQRTAAIVLFDAEGRGVRRYALVDAWPSKLEICGPRGAQAGLLTERLVISYAETQPG